MNDEPPLLRPSTHSRQGSPAGSAMSNLRSSHSSTSTANSTGTAVHHKSIQSGGVNLVAKLGLHQEQEQDPSSQDGPQSPFGGHSTKPESSAKTAFASKALRAVHTDIGAKGYDKGEYVTKLGTEEQERVIDATLHHIQQKSRPSWCSKLAFWKRKQ